MKNYISPPVELPPGSMVWAYVRDSGGEAQEQSVPQQKAEIEAYCKSHSLVLLHTFADVAKSAGSVAGREAFEDMIDLSSDENSRPNGLLIWNFARFARNLDDSGYYKALLRKRGLTVHSMTDPIPEGQYGRVVEMIIDVANEEKRRQTSRDVKRSLAALARQGFAVGGTPPRGYRAVKVEVGRRRDGSARIASKWEPDPELWDLVLIAWQMRADGKTYGEIREATFGRLYVSKPSWEAFFRNKTYLGIGKCGDLEIPNHHPAAVDYEIWGKVQALRVEKRRVITGGLNHPRRVGVPSLLSGIGVCAHCGSAMIKDRTGKNKWDIYLCGRKRRNGWSSCEGRAIDARAADAAVLEAVLTRILTPDFVEDLLSETRAQFVNVADLDREAEQLKRDLLEIEKKIGNLLEALESGSKRVLERLEEREIEQGRKRAELRLVEAKRQAAEVEITPEALTAALHFWIGEISESKQAGDIRALKGLLGRFIQKVELGYNQARVWYSYPIKALQEANGIGLYPYGGTIPIPLVCKALVINWE